MTLRRLIVLGLVVSLGITSTALAQNADGLDDKDKPASAPPADPSASPANATAQEDDPDMDPNPAQPDFTVVALPTTLRLPRHKSAFRVTHRFGRPLGAGDFGSLLEDLFGLDSGSQIGLEFRFGLFRRTQIGIHRTSDRTIQFFGQYDIVQQRDGGAFGLAAFATAEGTNNFRDSRTPGVGAILSHEFGDHAAIYAMPMWLHNTNLLPADLVDDNNTLLVGIGARLRIRPTVYVVGEYTPRAAGYQPRENQASFGIEKRLGGHSFQLNFSNGFGTTMGQLARGGVSNDDWFIGFNISRKFF
jgi:hypothetical protein